MEAEEQGSAANAVGERPATGAAGRDGYLVLQHVTTDPEVHIDRQYQFILHGPDGGEKDVLRHGEWITALIPADVAAELAGAGQLSATVYLVYKGPGGETNRDERAFEAQADGSFAANTLSARLVATSDDNFAALPQTDLTVVRAEK